MSAANRRPDASMTLINEMLQRPLDPGYAAAARRRQAAGLPAMTSVRTPVVAVTLLLIGLVLTTAVGVRNADRPAVTRVKADLIAQITANRSSAEAASAKISTLQGEISRAQGPADDVPRSELAALEDAAAAVAVTGPGLVVTLDDAPESAGDGSNADPRGSDDPTEGRVLSRDVQIVVNALWQSGAEAVAVNGQRLSPRSAIRFAGDAILVNFRPLTRPYTISAIGDPDSLPEQFGIGTGGEYLQTLSSNFGLVTDQKTSRSLTLPGATALTVRLARPLSDQKVQK